MLRTILLSALLLLAPLSRAADPLPSWNDTEPKKAIIAFVEKVTKEGSPQFIKPEERIATFDNDGTLWCEKPNYVQAVFALDRVKELAPQHPEWNEKEPFKSILSNNLKAALAGGEKALVELVMATHAGTTTAEFEQIVKDWIAKSEHPRFKQPYTKCIYQPMLELMHYLRDNGFQAYIVSGGGVEFMRPWTEQTYGIPPQKVVGSSIKTKYEMKDGKPVLERLPEIDFIDDGPGKPAGINSRIGRRPLMAFGNSDGDREMLEWTTMNGGPRFGLIVHHTDAVREYAYDRDSSVGRLDKALDEAPTRGWIVVSMKDDWKQIFQFEKPGAPK
ncbi:MAG: haloacid dehalogenase-like hydrolase [Phycisphaeraceae bacterium]|nr:haloacid dehalogenase-like hydrolase [Phycisphaeraceae bacterium]